MFSINQYPITQKDIFTHHIFGGSYGSIPSTPGAEMDKESHPPVMKPASAGRLAPPKSATRTVKHRSGRMRSKNLGVFEGKAAGWQGLVNVGKCPNVSHHPTIGDIISNRYLSPVM